MRGKRLRGIREALPLPANFTARHFRVRSSTSTLRFPGPDQQPRAARFDPGPKLAQQDVEMQTWSGFQATSGCFAPTHARRWRSRVVSRREQALKSQLHLCTCPMVFVYYRPRSTHWQGYTRLKPAIPEPTQPRPRVPSSSESLSAKGAQGSRPLMQIPRRRF